MLASNSTYYLDVDKDIVCGSATHVWLVVFASLIILTVIVGWPVAVFLAWYTTYTLHTHTSTSDTHTLSPPLSLPLFSLTRIALYDVSAYFPSNLVAWLDSITAVLNMEYGFLQVIHTHTHYL